MATRTRTQITIQTRQTIVVRSLRDSFKAWCELCTDVVLALTPESCATLLHMPLASLYGRLDQGELHVVEPGASAPLVCCNSLSTASTDNQILIEGERQ